MSELSIEETAKFLECSSTMVDRLVVSTKLRLAANGQVDEASILSYMAERDTRLDRVAAIAEADAKLGIDYR
jgi:hypothetical protein